MVKRELKNSEVAELVLYFAAIALALAYPACPEVSEAIDSINQYIIDQVDELIQPFK